MFISLSTVVQNPQIQQLVAPLFSDQNNHEHLINLLITTQGRVQNSKLTELYAPIISSLAQDSDVDSNKLYQIGLILKAEQLSEHAIEAITQNKNAATINAALPILLLNPKKNKAYLEGLAQDEDLPPSSRLQTTTALLRANPKAGHPLLAAFITGLNDTAQKAAIDRLSLSTHGAKALRQLLADEVISKDHFSYLSATRLFSTSKKNPAARKLMKHWSKKKEEEDALRAKKVEHLTEIATQLEGNVATGQALFQMCLSCHAVGDQGYSIAPALDGSASREPHALLTALLRPDVAVEGGYELTRVIHKDGTMIEGYLYSSNDIGVTIATQGNVQTFISRDDVKTETGVPDKSFMPSLLHALPDQNMIDLMSYIQTLK